MNRQSIEQLRIFDLPDCEGIRWIVARPNSQLLLSLCTDTEIIMRTHKAGIIKKRTSVTIEISGDDDFLTFRMTEPDPAVVFLPNWSVSGELVSPTLHRLSAQPDFQMTQLVAFLLGNLSLDDRYTVISEAVNRNAAAWYLESHPDHEDCREFRFRANSDTDDSTICMFHRNKTDIAGDVPVLSFVHRPPNAVMESAPIVPETVPETISPEPSVPPRRRQLQILSVELP